MWFCRAPGGKKTEVWRLMCVSGIVECVGGDSHFLRSVDDALRETEKEEQNRKAQDDAVDGDGSWQNSSRPGAGNGNSSFSVTRRSLAFQPEHDPISAEERRIGTT